MKGRASITLAATAGVLVASALASCGGGGGGGGGNAVISGAGLATPAAIAAELPARDALIARARSLELDTPYLPPPGDPLEHNTAGFAKTLCSSVFITGMDPGEAAEVTGYFTGPYAQRSKVGTPVVDRAKKEVRITMASGTTLTARYYGSQGCVTLAPGATDVAFQPEAVSNALPDPRTQAWPMGDVLPADRGTGFDPARVDQAVVAPFEQPGAYTTAFVVSYKGRIIGERYMSGVTASTPLESWSMGKSVTATLMGILIKQGVYTLDQPAPIPEWQSEGDKRQQIRISDLLHMSSGLRIKAPDDPDFDPNGTYPDHIYFYTGRIDAFNYAATRPQQWPPNTIGRYRNTDPVLVNYLIRLAVEKRGDDYLSFPQRALFDKIGVRSMTIEPDPHGNFLTQGHDFMSARDWARLGNLYLQDGVWNGERILPEGFVKFVSTVAPAWAADKRPIYGGFFWLNGMGQLPVPTSAYYMLGAGGQMVVIVPSHDLVVVRLGYDKGEALSMQGVQKALSLLMQGISPSR
jgi:CubicO group peptidase (beta-lactamase class C family)